MHVMEVLYSCAVPNVLARCIATAFGRRCWTVLFILWRVFSSDDLAEED